MEKNAKHYGNYLIVLLVLFSFRVFAQLLQAFHPVSFLPAFDRWHSDSLPYGVLLASQIIILLACLLVVWRFKAEKVNINHRIGLMCLIFGGLYFGLMVFRLIGSFSFGSDHIWLGASIPTLFHLVLATFVLVIGFYHSQYSQVLIKKSIYPFVMLSAVTAHYLCSINGVNLYLATYFPVLLAAALISYLEIKLPYRSEWIPNKNELKNDASYMVLVQLLLPRFLGFLVVIMLANAAQKYNLLIDSMWPHNSSIIVQAVMMLLLADFLRYWLHRASHRWKPLWKLHEVHHSPKKLYWMNVGRFHPIEKGMQYVFDALPFIVLGVSQEVLALYFVFYAINGFFQHCNIDLRLGVLNFLVSGPELHRWHHSKRIKESDNNFGNNLIIWDLIFSTRYLPSERSVGELGVLDDNYPTSLSAQLMSPFLGAKKS